MEMHYFGRGLLGGGGGQWLQPKLVTRGVAATLEMPKRWMVGYYYLFFLMASA